MQFEFFFVVYNFNNWLFGKITFTNVINPTGLFLLVTELRSFQLEN